jgi:hypothetical protein
LPCSGASRISSQTAEPSWRLIQGSSLQSCLDWSFMLLGPPTRGYQNAMIRLGQVARVEPDPFPRPTSHDLVSARRYPPDVPNLQAVYHRAPDGSEPVNDFIDRLSVKRQVVLDNQIDRLNMLTPSNPHLPSPHSSQVEGSFASWDATRDGSSTASCIGGLSTLSSCSTSSGRTRARFLRLRSRWPTQRWGTSGRVWTLRDAARPGRPDRL